MCKNKILAILALLSIREVKAQWDGNAIAVFQPKEIISLNRDEAGGTNNALQFFRMDCIPFQQGKVTLFDSVVLYQPKGVKLNTEEYKKDLLETESHLGKLGVTLTKQFNRIQGSETAMVTKTLPGPPLSTPVKLEDKFTIVTHFHYGKTAVVLNGTSTNAASRCYNYKVTIQTVDEGSAQVRIGGFLPTPRGREVTELNEWLDSLLLEDTFLSLIHI